MDHPLIPPPLPHQPSTTITTTNILKRKRTKRQRLQFVSNSPPSHNASSSSTTTEDEDTAKCLILLSKGHNSNYSDDFSGYKFNSKKYIQTSKDASTFAYVYECKTCSRTFPSFQALGGHRASHTKPKIKEFDQRQLSSSSPFSDEDEITMHQFSKKNNSSSSSSISLQLNNSKKSSSSNKLHECSICGAEFNSGQALGGHMRRHRVTNSGGGGAAANTTLSLIPYSSDQKCRNDGLCLDLDLNLPAPPETAAERRESSFKFTPTLVDCHY